MAEPHVIRLRGPWRCQQVRDDNDKGEADRADRTIDYASERGLREFFRAAVPGALCFRRRFQRPTVPLSGTTIRLVLDDCAASTAVQLNGKPLGVVTRQRAEFDINDHLQTSNELCLEVQFNDARPVDSLIHLFRVQLEISEP